MVWVIDMRGKIKNCPGCGHNFFIPDRAPHKSGRFCTPHCAAVASANRAKVLEKQRLEKHGQIKMFNEPRVKA